MKNQLVETNRSAAFSDDKLNRKFLAENLKRILLNTDYNVFSINAQWGGGKSYFIENLAQLIDDEAICISYNAWESDFYNNPLVPLVTEIMYKLEQVISEEDEIYKDLIKIKKTLMGIFDKITFNAGIKSFGITYDPNKPTVESDYIALKNLKEKLRSGFGFIQEKLNKKIIIFVDDLDRCNPKYAIETLETIKHFFGIKNIIFVLAVDKKQVENIVKTIYGITPETSDIEGYLKKFIDVKFNLPEPAYEEFIIFHLQNLAYKTRHFIENCRYYNYGEKINGTIINGKPHNSTLIHTVEILVDIFDFTPRAIEKLFMRVQLTVESLDENDLLLIEVIFILNALYIYNKEFFDLYINAKEFGFNQNMILKKIHLAIPYWSGVLNDFNGIFNDYVNNGKRDENTNKYNVIILHQLYREIFNLDVYLKSYVSKIEFIGSMD